MGIFQSKRFSIDDIPDLTGRVAIVTGGNAGLGEISVRQLARHGAKVYLFARSKQRALAAIERIRAKEATWAERIHFVQCDLADLESVEHAAKEFKSKETQLHILMNNAGVAMLPYGLTKQGLEVSNGINIVGPTLLTFLLLPTLAETARNLSTGEPSVRIVQLSSMVHQIPFFFFTAQRFTTLKEVNRKMWGGDYWSSVLRYSMSKTGGIYLTSLLEKHTRAAGLPISNISVHPGVVNTDIWDGTRNKWPFLRGFLTALFKLIFIMPEPGALTQLYAATSPEVDTKQLSNAYLVPYAKKGYKWGPAKDPKGARSAELYAFVKDFVKEKVQVDLDSLLKQAELTDKS